MTLTKKEDMRFLKLVCPVAAVAVGVLAYVAPASTESQNLVCNVYVTLTNDGRHVMGPVNTECGSYHSIPWGNWGVDSNIANRMDWFQFMGWKQVEGENPNQRQWNSCTSGTPPIEGLFNTDNHTTQTSFEGERWYGQVRVWTPWSGSCSEVFLDGGVYTSTGNFMDIWELDPYSPDQHVARADYPDTSVVLSCPYGSSSCESAGEWLDPLEVTPNVLFARIRMWVTASTEVYSLDGGN